MTRGPHSKVRPQHAWVCVPQFLTSIAAGLVADVPLLFGVNHDEGTLFMEEPVNMSRLHGELLLVA